MMNDGTAIHLHRRDNDNLSPYMPDSGIRALVASVPVYLYCVEYMNGMPVYTFHSPHCEAITGYMPFDYGTDPDLWIKMVHPEDRKKVMGFFNGPESAETGTFPLCFTGPLHKGSRVLAIDHRIITKHGEVRWISNHCVATRGVNGNIERMDGVVMDVTEQKESEEDMLKQLSREARLAYDLAQEKKKAEEALAQNDKFVSLVSHDLRSPIATIIGLLKLWGRADYNPWKDDPETLIRRMTGIGDYMLNMIDELLNLSRLKQGSIKLNQRHFDLCAAVNRVLDAIAPQAELKGIKVINAVEPCSRIFADMNLASELIHNLVSNAVKFCRTGDSIMVSANCGQNVSVSVRDTGPGINPAFLPDLFRYDVATTSPGSAGEKGTGFGLPFCNEVLRIHKGTLRVESGPGKGTVFTAEFPSVKPVILVVDDEENRRFILREHIRSLNAEGVEVENGAEALAHLHRGTAHLVLSDIKMPVMDGLELLAKVRGDANLRNIPFIVLTSSGDKSAGERALQIGADDFMPWPAKEEDLLPRIRRFIS
ncbi:MAG: response regulator [Nitrospinae bacterium]|nr:response regulator [Nitrospinota bacterium]